MIKQEFALLECCGCEAKNRYRISVPKEGDDGKEGDIFLYIDEESECLQRVCCSKFRSLTLRVHEGPTKDGNIVQSMYKPFSCGGIWCCLRPKFTVWDGPKDKATVIGNIDDPCKLCVMDQQVFDAKSNLMFNTSGSICQLGICCPCCSSVTFDVTREGTNVASIEKMPLTCGECFKKTNRFVVDFKDRQDPLEKRMIFASAMLLDLEYFEENKNDK